MAADLKSRGDVKKSFDNEIDPDQGWVETRSAQKQWIEYTLICLCNIAWAIDSSILPVFFKEFQTYFDVSQTALQGLSSAKGITAALFGFPCGFVQELLPRPLLVAMGMGFWSLGLFICAIAPTFPLMFAGRVLNGMGLGVVQPLLLSLVADKNAPSKRGSAFGSMFFVAAVCNTLFTLGATTFTDAEVAGIPGWRISLLVVTVVSAALGLATFLLVEEPHAQRLATAKNEKRTFASVFTKNLPKVFQLFKYPTFVLILCQGAPGTAPWTIFPNFTQWLQLSCFSNSEAALIFSAFGWGTAVSSLISGLTLNFVARRFPNHGPPSLANFSVASGIPFLMLFFYILPKPAELGAGWNDVPAFYASFLLFGMCAAMCGTINKKVFSDIVPSHIYSYVFAIDQVIENSIGNLFPLTLGLLVDKVFDYDKSAVKPGECAPEEGEKLGKGMFIVCNVAWGICFTVYTGMHCTYPKDRARQLAMRAKELTLETNRSKASAEVDVESSGSRE